MNHRLNRRRHVRAVVLAGLFGVAAAQLSGCWQSSDADAEPKTTVSPEERTTWQFDSPQAVIDHIGSLSTGDEYIELMEHMYHRSESETWAAKYAVRIAEARLEFLELLNVAFASDDEPAVDTDLGMKQLAEALKGKEIQPLGETRTVVEYQGIDGEPAKLVLAKIRDQWQVHVTSLSNGEEIDAAWCVSRQDQFAAQLKYHRDMSMALRKGMYDSVEEAQQALQERLDGPAPPRGSSPLRDL